MILLWIAVVFLSCTLAATGSFAKGKGKGKGPGASAPSGWSKGEKKSWQTDVPAGLEDKDKAGDPSGLTQEKKVQEGNEKVEKLQEKEQKRSREKERHRDRDREEKQKKE